LFTTHTNSSHACKKEWTRKLRRTSTVNSGVEYMWGVVTCKIPKSGAKEKRLESMHTATDKKISLRLCLPVLSIPCRPISQPQTADGLQFTLSRASFIFLFGKRVKKQRGYYSLYKQTECFNATPVLVLQHKTNFIIDIENNYKLKSKLSF